MKLSTKGRYALIAMAYIARKDFSSKVSVAEISNKLGISQTYLEQLFMKLRKANLVRASRGASGGFSLNMHQKNIRIHNIMEAVDENFAAVSSENRYETNISPKPLELDLTEKSCQMHAQQQGIADHKKTGQQGSLVSAKRKSGVERCWKLGVERYRKLGVVILKK